MPNSGPIKKTQAPAPATSAAPELLRDPEPIARPTEVLLLQRHAGNQAVERWLHAGQAPAPVPAAPVMIQTKPVAGRGDSATDHTQEREPARAAPTLIVDDDAESVGPGQMRKSEFLDQLRSEVCAAADDALRDTIWSTMGCPYIERWFNHYQEQSSQHVERALRHYAPETASARTARDYIPLITQRVRRGVAEWARTGEVSGVPPELAQQGQGMPGATLQGLVGAGLSALGGAVSGLVSGAGRALSSVGRALFKPRAGGAHQEADPHALQARLGEGHALEGSVRARMETVFGQSFAQVRLHTDAHAAHVSDGLNARAFTVGRHVAFGAGEYQPGTLIGDALIAHELAHVAQQGQGAATSGPLHKGGGAYTALEDDADVAAVGAVAALWGGAQGRLSDIGQQAMPRLQSGLQLQRCASSQRPQSHPLTLAALATMTPWQLSQLSDADLDRAAAGQQSSTGHRVADYKRASHLARAVFTELQINFDMDTFRDPLGEEPNPQELQIVNTILSQILATDSGAIERLVAGPGGRGVPTGPGSATPSLQGKVRLWRRSDTRSQGQFSAKAYRHNRLLNLVPDDLNGTVSRLLDYYRLEQAPPQHITEQELRIAQLTSAADFVAGFYLPEDDIIYLRPGTDLSTPAARGLVRHETAHLLGGRERTRQAFMNQYGSNYLRYYVPFEEGMAEFVRTESQPVGESSPTTPGVIGESTSGTTTVTVEVGEEYAPYLTWINRLVSSNSRDRELLLQAYFTGAVPASVFTLIEREPPPQPPR